MPASAWLPHFGFKNPLLIACFPKSGSTFLAKLLSFATGFPTRDVVESYGHRDQDISESKLRQLSRRVVIQQHVKATDRNAELMNKFGIRPIVLTRNLFDVVVSLDDHLRREDHRMPTGFVHREYMNLEFDQRVDYLIRIHLPWYFNFFMSWREAARELPTFPLTYERLFSNVRQSLEEILSFYRISVSQGQISAALDKVRCVDTRFNQGCSNRGDKLLNARHKASIRDLAAVWRIDASEMESIGLGPAPLKLVA
jgi:Sulfotransferase domain